MSNYSKAVREDGIELIKQVRDEVMATLPDKKPPAKEVGVMLYAAALRVAIVFWSKYYRPQAPGAVVCKAAHQHWSGVVEFLVDEAYNNLGHKFKVEEILA